MYNTCCSIQFSNNSRFFLFREDEIDICWFDKILEKWNKLKLLVCLSFLQQCNSDMMNNLADTKCGSLQ